MSIAEHEERIRALEAAVTELKSQLPADEANHSSGLDEGVIQGTDHPLVPGVPPKQSVLLRAKVAAVQEGPSDFGLSPAEWSRLDLRNADE